MAWTSTEFVQKTLKNPSEVRKENHFAIKNFILPFCLGNVAPPKPNECNPIVRAPGDGDLINRGSYMSAPVLLNLLNELGEKIRCGALPSILSVFPNEFNKFSNTGARMQDSVYHMTLKSNFISKFCIKTSRFRH